MNKFTIIIFMLFSCGSKGPRYLGENGKCSSLFTTDYNLMITSRNKLTSLYYQRNVSVESIDKTIRRYFKLISNLEKKYGNYNCQSTSNIDKKSVLIKWDDSIEDFDFYKKLDFYNSYFIKSNTKYTCSKFLKSYETIYRGKLESVINKNKEENMTKLLIKLEEELYFYKSNNVSTCLLYLNDDDFYKHIYIENYIAQEIDKLNKLLLKPFF